MKSSVKIADIVGDMNAKFSELVTVIDVVNLTEGLLDENRSEFSSKKVEALYKDALKVVEKRLGVTDLEELDKAFNDTKQQLTLTMQLDRLTQDFVSIGASQKLVSEMEKLKEKNLKELSRKLSFNLDDYRTESEVVSE